MGAGFQGVTWFSAAEGWCWRVVDAKQVGISVGAGAASEDAAWAAAADAALHAWGARSTAQQAAAAVSDALDDADLERREPWDLGFIYGPQQRPWMVGRVHGRLCEVARAAYGLRGITRVLHEHAVCQGSGEASLSRAAAEGLIVAAGILSEVIEGAVDLIDLERAAA